jgi:hypothetical protein
LSGLAEALDVRQGRLGFLRDVFGPTQPCLAFLLALWWPMAQPAAAPIFP